AATDDNALNTEIFEDCQKLKTLCNVVDVPHLCNFYVPAVINRGDLQLAISTNGKCPAYAGRLRRKFQELITEDHGRFLELLDSARQSVIDKIQAHKRSFSRKGLPTGKQCRKNLFQTTKFKSGSLVVLREKKYNESVGLIRKEK
ncbi:MAG: precorrin-2 dehydrogenase/sirohydrochlorin ferrochelatase family protein, partial [Planctomycetota bacterium]